MACSPEAGKTTDTAEFLDQEPQFLPYASDGDSVEQVEPSKYLGLWYEIATTPSQQQRFCSGTMAEYSLVDDTTIGVLNSCYVGSLDGNLNQAQATATAIDDTYARLMVDFGFGFESPYTVIELVETPGEELYNYAVVSNNDVQFWILSRTPQMPEEMYAILLDRIEERGADSSSLIQTEQPLVSDGEL